MTEDMDGMVGPAADTDADRSTVCEGCPLWGLGSLGRDMAQRMAVLFPADFAHHMFAAQREVLLGLRSLIDASITRSEQMEKRFSERRQPAAARPTKIKVS